MWEIWRNFEIDQCQKTQLFQILEIVICKTESYAEIPNKLWQYKGMPMANVFLGKILRAPSQIFRIL